jgi:hypothetical protein
MASRIVAIAALLSLSACGPQSAQISSAPDASGALDCTWVDESNCWKTAIAAAANCLPPSSQQGTLSADGQACTYDSGTVVAFASPLVAGSIVSGSTALLPNFTVTSGNMPCLGFQLGAMGAAITTQGGVVTFGVQQTQSVEILTCPDGATYSGLTAGIQSCDSYPGLALGGTAIADDGGLGQPTLTLSLTGTDDPNGTTVFDCASP